MANQMGKRYTCTVCEATVLVTKAGAGTLSVGTTALVTKAGDGELTCHGQVMEMPAAAPLPSSD